MQFSDLDLSKTYTYADYYSWTFKERIELFSGKVFKLAHPFRIHQEYVMKIAMHLYKYLEGKKSNVCMSPFDVRLPDGSNDDKNVTTVEQPMFV